ncbi:EamA family transporter [Limibacillus halophilus]|uniref:Putative blue pigment (Indigoidine) exporter n=1 Tax=Limibacillus halophilus TaxID=1579333 RepID=A0A839SWK9_9PROT|nr:EamA family transporter [Limibacillus halophilus]MBB3066429.1 putative blue pigment (indigoidine) exporter [Limibacillus halophilus]
MNRNLDLMLTALAPAIWGSSYLVTTQFLPDGYPVTVAFLRALPAGLLLLLVVRRLPSGWWWLRVAILGALNFSIFWTLLFVAAYRLPGGVAATVGAIQPLVVVFLARGLLGSPIRGLSVLAALFGLGGVALLLLTPQAALDPLGVAAGLGGAVSMAAGTVLSRKWQPPVGLLTFTAWQLTAGGFILLPLAFLLEPALPPLTDRNVMGLAYLGLIGAAFTYALWFRGIARLEPAAVSALGFLSPTTAVVLGWLILGEALTPLQGAGILIVLASVWLSQQAGRLRVAFPIARCNPGNKPLEIET